MDKINLVRNASIEVTPNNVDGLLEYQYFLKENNTRVFLPWLLGTTLDDLTTAVMKLSQAGIIPVPHIVARSLKSEQELDEVLRRWNGDANIEEVMVVGGNQPWIRGPFKETGDVLRPSLLEKRGIKRCALAAHPEGEGDLLPQGHAQVSLCEKIGYSNGSPIEFYFMSQLCYDFGYIRKWIGNLIYHYNDFTMEDKNPNRIKTVVGLPGVVSLRTMINYSVRCGVKDSLIRYLKKCDDTLQLGQLITPDEFIDDLSVSSLPLFPKVDVIQSSEWFGGIHFYTLGILQNTLTWMEDEVS